MPDTKPSMERKIVKLRYLVNEPEEFRSGPDTHKSIAILEVDPEELSPEQRTLLADRLHGIDVCQLQSSEQGITKQLDLVGRTVLVEAMEATFAGLMKAVKQNQSEVEKSQARQRGLAIAMASAALDQAAALDEIRTRAQGNTTLSW